MSQITLRAASPVDVPALSALAASSFIAKFGPLYSAADLQTFLHGSLSEAAVAAQIANPDRLYQLAQGEIGLLGFAKIGLTCGFPEHARGTAVMELKQLYTAPEATGQGSTDPVAAAKVMNNFAKANDKFVIKSGAMPNQVMNAAGVQALASMLSRDELLAKFARTLNEVPTKFARALAAVRDAKAA